MLLYIIKFPYTNSFTERAIQYCLGIWELGVVYVGNSG